MGTTAWSDAMPASTRLHHRFNAKQFPFSLWRLSDEEYRQLRLRNFPIKVDGFFVLRTLAEITHPSLSAKPLDKEGFIKSWDRLFLRGSLNWHWHNEILLMS
jgi:hypothetical protein